MSAYSATTFDPEYGPEGATGPTGAATGTTGATGATGASVSGATGATGAQAISYVKLTSDFGTTTTTTLANITGLSFSVVAGNYYRFEFDIAYTFSSASTTANLKTSVTIPAATVFSANAGIMAGSADGTDAWWVGRITASDDAVTAVTNNGATLTSLSMIDGVIVPSDDGTLQARYASSETANTITIKRGSCGILIQLP